MCLYLCASGDRTFSVTQGRPCPWALIRGGNCVLYTAGRCVPEYTEYCVDPLSIVEVRVYHGGRGDEDLRGAVCILSRSLGLSHGEFASFAPALRLVTSSRFESISCCMFLFSEDRWSTRSDHLERGGWLGLSWSLGDGLRAQGPTACFSKTQARNELDQNGIYCVQEQL